MAKRTKENDDFKFEITEEIGVIKTNPKTCWTTEINMVSWNEREPVVDIRAWDEEHEHCSKGITLTEKDAKKLAKFIDNAF